jgi:hypothetical protein
LGVLARGRDAVPEADRKRLRRLVRRLRALRDEIVEDMAEDGGRTT